MRSEPELEVVSRATIVPLPETPVDPGRPEFWLPRLVHRKYGDLAQPSWPRQYSARIEHQGVGFYFPLGSDERLRAARRAREIYETVLMHGWPAVFQRFSREVTLAVFWSRHPIACTYTTLYTEPRSFPKAESSSRRMMADKRRVLLIEPDPAIGAALTRWLDRPSRSHCGAWFRSAREALRSDELREADLCLFNQHLPDLSESEGVKKLRSVPMSLPAFSYGIYEQSDDIFASLSGVHEGYYLRRRSPVDMLDPIQAAWQDGARAREQLDQGITRYFQDLFVVQSRRLGVPETSALTSREQEVLNCLRKGYPDKQIADALAIRPSTVHTHLKKIFEKLGVHSRMEAVMKHLQK